MYNMSMPSMSMKVKPPAFKAQPPPESLRIAPFSRCVDLHQQVSLSEWIMWDWLGKRLSESVSYPIRYRYENYGLPPGPPNDKLPLAIRSCVGQDRYPAMKLFIGNLSLFGKTTSFATLRASLSFVSIPVSIWSVNFSYLFAERWTKDASSVLLHLLFLSILRILCFWSYFPFVHSW